jgi:hypothetical protein
VEVEVRGMAALVTAGVLCSRPSEFRYHGFQEALDGEVWRCLFGMAHGLVFESSLLHAGSKMQPAAGGCELQAAMRDRHWTDFACSRRFRRLGSRRGELVDLVAVQRAAGYNTGLAKVTTSDKALPCSHPVCALRPP